MVMADVIGAIGPGLPKGYRDALFLRERLLVLLSEDAICDHFSIVANDQIEGMPLSLICSKVSASAYRSEKSFLVFPIDLARYPSAQIQAWVAGTQCNEVVVVHASSRDVLISAGYRGIITLALIPDVTSTPLPKRQMLRMTSVFRWLDSREQRYDSEWLMPGYQSKASDEEAPVVVADSLDDTRGAPTVKSLRFRLGATKRHFLNLVEELLEPTSNVSDVIRDEPIQEDMASAYQVVNLMDTATVFTMVLDDFSSESCWEDVVKAFCVAFRFESNVTLLIFLSGNASEQSARDFNHVLCALYPFSCRLLLVQGMLDDMEYEALMAFTNIYIDVNRRATLRPDLRHFSAAGILTIGFFESSEDEDDAMLVDFRVHHCDEPGFCDFGDDPRYQTIVRRLDWESLLTALTKAHEQVITYSNAIPRVDRISSTLRLEQQKIAWRQVLRKTFG